VFESLFEALFSYRPVVFQQGEFRFDVTAASLIATLVVAVVVGLAVLTYRRVRVNEGRTRDRIVPYTVFIDPQLGRVGMTEREARAHGRAIRVATLPMNAVVRAIETGETRGFMKAIIDADNGQILGCSILGSEGGEIMTVIQVAMLGKLTDTAMADAIFTHPLLAEGLNTLFAAVDA